MNSIEKEIKYATEFNPQIVKDNEAILKSCGYDEFYRKMTAFNNETQDPLERAKLWMINNVFKKRAGGKVIDVGCGMGSDCYRIETLGYDVTGIDKDKTKMDFCNKLEEHYTDKKVRFINSHLLDFKAERKEFDIAYSCMMIEHMRSPANAFQAMGWISNLVCGIIHMGQKAEDNPYHTRYLDIKSVKHLLDGYLAPTYTLEILDEYVFAMFYGMALPINDYMAGLGLNTKLIEVGIQGKWKNKSCEIKEVEINKIHSTFNPTDSFQESVVNDYVSCLEMFGRMGIEKNIFPISLVHIPDTDNYTVFDDGNHRICALKRFGKINVINAKVLELEREV